MVRRCLLMKSMRRSTRQSYPIADTGVLLVLLLQLLELYLELLHIGNKIFDSTIVLQDRVHSDGTTDLHALEGIEFLFFFLFPSSPTPSSSTCWPSRSRSLPLLDILDRKITDLPMLRDIIKDLLEAAGELPEGPCQLIAPRRNSLRFVNTASSEAGLSSRC